MEQPEEKSFGLALAARADVSQAREESKFDDVMALQEELLQVRCCNTAAFCYRCICDGHFVTPGHIPAPRRVDVCARGALPACCLRTFTTSSHLHVLARLHRMRPQFKKGHTVMVLKGFLEAELELPPHTTVRTNGWQQKQLLAGGIDPFSLSLSRCGCSNSTWTTSSCSTRSRSQTSRPCSRRAPSPSKCGSSGTSATAAAAVLAASDSRKRRQETNAAGVYASRLEIYYYVGSSPRQVLKLLRVAYALGPNDE